MKRAVGGWYSNTVLYNYDFVSCSFNICAYNKSYILNVVSVNLIIHVKLDSSEDHHDHECRVASRASVYLWLYNTMLL